MIEFKEDIGLFHLSNREMSVVLSLRDDGDAGKELLLAYLGNRIDQPEHALSLINTRRVSNMDFLRDMLPYACPTEGRGDFRPIMVSAVPASGQRCTELHYVSHRVEWGKPALEGLPAAYVEAPDEAQTLTVRLRDALTGLEAELMYTLYAHRPILAVSARYFNGGDAPLVLESAGSACVTLPGRFDLLHLKGAWARERAVERVSPSTTTTVIASSRGASGHEHNPFAVLAGRDCGEFDGECLGAALVYSGDFAIAVDENPYESTRMVIGINPRTFRWRLDPGERFQAPEGILAWSKKGLNGMSQALHGLLRERVCRGEWRDRERPILINNWEATYFDFDQEKILRIARAAAALGIELFVLDDGWFGRRDAANCSLGDWVVDRRKLPDGLDGLARAVEELGMHFGLWLEPEMVSPDSDLYRRHPDWCLHARGRRRTTARNQLILDLSRRDVQDYVIGAVTEVLNSAPISYVKWDMNRNFTEAGSALLEDSGRQGEIAHRYMLGLYRVLEAVTSAFPKVLFESCASGGGRFDAGMLFYMPQTWTSDDTDAVERLFIQYGTSLGYPVSAMGAHVSAVPNHQVGRMTCMKMRGDVALSGNFGYELDISAQSPEDLEEMWGQIALAKTVRRTIQRGVFTRLSSPFEGNVAAWQFVDRERIVLCAFRIMAGPNPAPIRIRLRDVPEGLYRDSTGTTYTAGTLTNIGILPGFPAGDYVSSVTVFDRCEP